MKSQNRETRSSQINLQSKKISRLARRLTLMFTVLCLVIATKFYFSTSPLIATSDPLLRLHSAIPAIENNRLEQPTTADSVTNTTPFISIEPSQDGNSVTFSIGQDTQLEDQLYANVRTGPSGDKLGWTMTYSDSEQSYVVTVPGFSPTKTEEGSVNITTTQGVNSPDTAFNRVYVPAASTQSIRSLDDVLQLELINAGTFSNDTYVVVATNQTLPGALPTNHRLFGHSYSLRPAGRMMSVEQSMSVAFIYSGLLEGTDPHTLGLFYWLIDSADPNGGRWVEIASTLVQENDSLMAETKLFGTYALLGKPSWSTDFAALDSLEPDSIQNLRRAGSALAPHLALDTTPGVGSARSIPISPALGVESWGILSFTADVAAPGTKLSVDVLSLDGSEILTDVQPGSSLAQIDAQTHPAIRLQVNMSSTGNNASPSLISWGVSWQPPQPMLIKADSVQATLGQTMTVPILLAHTSSRGLSAASLVVTYDPTLLNISGCTVVAPQLLAGVCNSNVVTNAAEGQIRLNLITTEPIMSETTLAELTLNLVAQQATTTTIGIAVRLATDANGKPLPVVTEAGEVTPTGMPTGDVNCDGQTNRTDIEAILAYDVGLMQPSTTCPPQPNTLFLPQCDLNSDTICDLRDALFIQVE